MVEGKQILKLLASSGEATWCFVATAFCCRSSETESEEGRPFAMMAAQGLDVLWIQSSFSLIFLVLFTSGADNGMFTVVYVCMAILSVN